MSAGNPSRKTTKADTKALFDLLTKGDDPIKQHGRHNKQRDQVVQLIADLCEKEFQNNNTVTSDDYAQFIYQRVMADRKAYKAGSASENIWGAVSKFITQHSSGTLGGGQTSGYVETQFNSDLKTPLENQIKFVKGRIGKKYEKQQEKRREEALAKGNERIRKKGIKGKVLAAARKHTKQQEKIKDRVAKLTVSQETRKLAAKKSLKEKMVRLGVQPPEEVQAEIKKRSERIEKSANKKANAKNNAIATKIQTAARGMQARKQF